MKRCGGAWKGRSGGVWGIGEWRGVEGRGVAWRGVVVAGGVVRQSKAMCSSGLECNN